MHKKIVIKSGTAWQSRWPLGFQRDRKRAQRRIRCKAIGPALDNALARSAERRQHPQPRSAPPARGEPSREYVRRLAVAHETDGARTPRKMPHQPLERRRVKAQANHVFKTPAQPRGRKRKGR